MPIGIDQMKLKCQCKNTYVFHILSKMESRSFSQPVWQNLDFCKQTYFAFWQCCCNQTYFVFGNAATNQSPMPLALCIFIVTCNEQDEQFYINDNNPSKYRKMYKPKVFAIPVFTDDCLTRFTKLYISGLTNTTKRRPQSEQHET